MKILFLISNMKEGRGGHNQSLLHIARIMSYDHSVRVCAVGPGEAKVLRQSNLFAGHFYFNGLNIMSLKGQLSHLLNSFKPDILHCFDNNVYNVVRVLVPSRRYKLVLTKCGGPNSDDYPYADNMIMFSKENMDWITENKKFKKAHLALIPNRVYPVEVQPYDEVVKQQNEFTFVRISRLSTYYKESLFASIRLVRKLNSLTNRKLRLYIIGVIQDWVFYRELVKFIGNDSFISLITEAPYIDRASKMLYLADAVIATGRSLMEATSLGLPVLAPAKNSPYPILLNENNFDDFFKMNFSERAKVSEADRNLNLDQLTMLLEDRAFYQQQSEFSYTVFAEHFDINKVNSIYTKFYTDLRSRSSRVPHSDLKLILKSFYHFYVFAQRRKKLHGILAQVNA